MRTLKTLALPLGLALVIVAAPGCNQPDTEVVKTTYKEGEEAAKPAAEAPKPAPTASMALTLDGSPSMGAAVAKVTIVESSDFQWPYCGRVGPTLKQLVKEYPNDVKVVFKHNPLGFHKRAMPIAKASMAAHMQGKFWEFHDLVFERKAYDDAKLETIATELGLDVAKWKTDQALPEVEKKILHDQASMVGHAARGTPACFINGKLVSGAKPYAAFKTEVDAAIKAADALIAAGTKLEDVHAKLAEKNGKKTYVDSVINGGTPPKPPPPKPRKPPQDATKQVQIDVHKDDPSMGPKKAPIVLATFSDFQWPYCARVGPTLKQLMKDYPKDLRIIFKQQPLPFHKDARPAAKASLAAHKQGKFWEYHDVLFENMKKLKPEHLEEYAKGLKLNMKKFKKDMADASLEEQVKRDQALAAKVGARGTPTSFVNGYMVRGAQPVDAFKRIIDRELAKLKGGKGAKGAKGKK